ncbi:MAG: hypothetical protein PHC75_06325 [Burkholderiales bacterium]|nr:hypothetical protein [Burkholderiales bacterium]
MKRFFLFLSLVYIPAYADNILLKGSDKPKQVRITSNSACYEYGKFNVITKPLSTGELILVKKDDCLWNESKGWVVNSGLASFFAGVYKNKIIIDQGTLSAPRDLLIYDIHTKKQVFNSRYFTDVYLSNNKLIYWDASNKVATKDNCIVFESAISSGLSATLMNKMVVDLSNDKFKIKKTNIQRCELTQ